MKIFVSEMGKDIENLSLLIVWGKGKKNSHKNIKSERLKNLNEFEFSDIKKLIFENCL